MKSWIVIGLAVIGGVAVFKYIRKTPFGAAFTPEQTGHNPRNSAAAAVASVVPGIPTFAGMPAINRPDQIAAARVTNPLATIDGSDGYHPAFGPDTNQPSSNMLLTF